jgi:hypothetical protein
MTSANRSERSTVDGQCDEPWLPRDATRDGAVVVRSEQGLLRVVGCDRDAIITP